MTRPAWARVILGGLFSAALLLLASFVAASTAATTLTSRDGTWIVALLGASVGGCLGVGDVARRFNARRPACRRCGRRFSLTRWAAVADDDGYRDYTPVHTCRARWPRRAQHARTP